MLRGLGSKETQSADQITQKLIDINKQIAVPTTKAADCKQLKQAAGEEEAKGGN